MFIFIGIIVFIISVTISSLLILYFVRKEVIDTRREVIHLYAELRQNISEQQLQLELIKHAIKNMSYPKSARK